VAQYRSATGLETLFGFLRLTNRVERIDELFSQIWGSGEDSTVKE
jgi:23S rRNA maturation mini-RNase III